MRSAATSSSLTAIAIRLDCIGKNEIRFSGELPASLQKELLHLPSLASDVALKAFPIETAFEQHVLALGRESHHGGVQILLVIEIGLANEARYSGSSPTFEPSSNCRMPPARKRCEIDVQHHRVVGGQPFEHGGGGMERERYQITPQA